VWPGDTQKCNPGHIPFTNMRALYVQLLQEVTPMSTSNPSQKCKNCGHDRTEHTLDDACWAEIKMGGHLRLCSCPGFEPATSDERRRNHPRSPNAE
jgi:hypothetical protein